eukprot:3445214-Prymnesium_polylepis.1
MTSRVVSRSAAGPRELIRRGRGTHPSPRSHMRSIGEGNQRTGPSRLEVVDLVLARFRIAGTLERQPTCFGLLLKGLGVDQGLYVR